MYLYIYIKKTDLAVTASHGAFNMHTLLTVVHRIEFKKILISLLYYGRYVHLLEVAEAI